MFEAGRVFDVQALDDAQYHKRKSHLERIDAMLGMLGGRGYCVKEEAVAQGAFDSDGDTDTDSVAGES